MRALICTFLLTTAAIAQGAVTRPERDVVLIDARGFVTRLTGFRRVSGDDNFRGYRGAARILVPFDRVREFEVRPSPGGAARTRVRIHPVEGEPIEGEYDEQEGGILYAGYANFGKITIFFRDIRRLTILRKSDPEKAPDLSDEGYGVDAEVRDLRNVKTRLTGFRRLAGGDRILGVRGSMHVMIPTRSLKRLVLARDEDSRLLKATASLRDGSQVAFHLPPYEEKTVYGGRSDLGRFRITLGDLREVVVSRATPAPPTPKGKDRGKKAAREDPDGRKPDERMRGEADKGRQEVTE